MMEEILLEVSLILILVNGFFAAAEISVVSSSRSRLQAMAAADHSGARRVLALRGDSERAGPDGGNRLRIPQSANRGLKA